MTKMNDLATVIIPVYNRERFIKECVDSIYEQKYRPIELILVDDGSTDNTLQICESFKKDFSKSDFQINIIPQSNQGAPAARNKGFRHSHGEYIIFMDSDDILLPHKIDKEIEAIKINDYDYVYSDAVVIKSGINTAQHLCRSLSGNNRDYFLFSWQTMCATYKKNFLEKVGPWNENLSIDQDWEFHIRVILKSTNCRFINHIHQRYHIHPGVRIGDKLDIKKVESKENAAWSLWNRLKDLNMIDEYLRKGYQKRFVYCALSYAVMGKKEQALNLLKKLHKQALVNLFFYKIFWMTVHMKGAGIILNLHKFGLKISNINFDKLMI